MGDFHYAGCFVERCPTCGGQAVSCQCEYQESFPRHPMSTARRRFYKFFYLAFLPMGLVFLLLWFIPYSLPGIVCAALVLGVPGVLTILLWNKLGDMELHQIITTPKG